MGDKTRARWTSAETGQLRRMAEAGTPYNEIAIAMGRTPSSIRSRADKLDIMVKRWHFRVPAEDNTRHPLVNLLVLKMREQNMSTLQLSVDSGIRVSVFKRWYQGAVPTLENLEAAFSALGLTLQPVRINS